MQAKEKPMCFKERITICEGCKFHRVSGIAHGCVKSGIYEKWKKENGVVFHFSPVVYKEGIPAPCHPETCKVTK